MNKAVKSFCDGLFGYLLAVLLTTVVITTIEIVTFRPGEEFQTRFEAATFAIVVWLAFGLIVSGAGFAAGFVWVNVVPRAATRLAGVLGFVAGTTNACLIGFGVLGRISRANYLPQPLVMVAASAAIGVATAITVIGAGLALRGRAAA